MVSTEITELIKREGWDLRGPRKDYPNGYVVAYGEFFPIVHPFLIHAKLYRLETNPDKKYLHMKAMHDYMWPGTLWHYWTERRFRAHCRGKNFITYAGGSAASKSYDAAKIAILFWLANPKERTVIVASTSLASLSSRIWGYVIKHLNKSAIFNPIAQLGGQAPRVLYDYRKEGIKTRDEIHGMFAIAAKQGDDERVISTWIGRHPDDAIMIVLDEATDMPAALVKALPNLESGVNFFQCMAIGNSSSRFDLHGALSTPRGGWDSVDPHTDVEWETTQKNGICLFFSCYESPAIFEADAARKAELGKFLITAEQVKEKEQLYGKDSVTFWRFVLGFWPTDTVDETVISRKFISDFDVFEKAEWSGLYPLSVVAGLDAAFSTGGDGCILRLGVLGVAIEGKVVLDFRGDELLFKIKILATREISAELQIARQVIDILRRFRVQMRDLAVDASGQGRALAEVIKLEAREFNSPLKVYSTRNLTNARQGIRGAGDPNSDIDVITPYELWYAFRDFIQNRQIRGMDTITASQLTSRLIVGKGGKPGLEDKRSFKNRMSSISPSLAHSPDEADAASLCLRAAILNYGFSPGQRKAAQPSTQLVDEKYAAYRAIHGLGARGEKQEVKRGPPPVATFSSDLSEVLDHKDRFSGF